eukprot:03409.XXX_102270_103252_1 [CDS] Oithona nana genome sequencing.
MVLHWFLLFTLCSVSYALEEFQPEENIRSQLQYYGDEQRDFEGLGRTFGVSNISLVITYVTVIIAALMLAGFLWVAFAYSGSGKRRKRRDAFYDDEDMVAKLHWINESFRKYQIEDVGCQLYVACEAGKLQGLNKHPKFGRLTTMIHKLISPIELGRVDQLQDDVKSLFLAYQEGAMLSTTCEALYSAICSRIQE